jgi:TolB protein
LKWIVMLVAIAAGVVATGSAASTPAPRLAFSDPAWSHRGNKIALAGRRPSGQFALFVMNANGSSIRQVAPYMAFLRWPTWSKDDRSIAYATGNGGIWKVAAAGGKPRRITRFGIEPSWSPNGRTIAFVSGGETQGNRVYTVAPDGSRLRVVAKPTVYRSFVNPAWSPLGLRLIFAVWTAPDTPTLPGYLGVIPSRGGRLTKLLSRYDPFQPSWSPRGRYIAFSEHGLSVSVLDLLTGAVRHLHSGRGPTWSPDGTRIAFERAGVIYSMNRDGSNVRRLTPCRVSTCR